MNVSKRPAAAPSKPALTPKSAADLAARQAREAAALRANLLRRKEQTRKPG
jgi:hypothetical protein